MQALYLKTSRTPCFNICIRANATKLFVVIIVECHLSSAGKVLALLILYRIIKHVNNINLGSQRGFRSCCGTIVMIFSLRYAIEKLRKKSKESLLIFVLLTQSFDVIYRQKFWEFLKKLGMPDKMLNVISLHEGMKAIVISGGESSLSFEVTNGSKRGCAMALVLFALFSVMLRFALATSEVMSSSSFEQLVDYSIISVSKPECCYATLSFVA